jgi:hypothetical protein
LRQGAVLLGGVQLAMQGEDVRIEAAQALGGAADLAPAGQEGQHVAGLARHHVADGAGHRLGQVARLQHVALRVLQADGVGAAQALDQRRVHQRGEGAAVQRGGHGQQPQLRPQPALEVEAQREAEIGVEVALMRLVEDHAGHASSRVVIGGGAPAAPR